MDLIIKISPTSEYRDHDDRKHWPSLDVNFYMDSMSKEPIIHAYMIVEEFTGCENKDQAIAQANDYILANFSHIADILFEGLHGE